MYMLFYAYIKMYMIGFGKGANLKLESQLSQCFHSITWYTDILYRPLYWKHVVLYFVVINKLLIHQ